MKRVQQRQLLFFGWVLALTGLAPAESVDPCFPSERTAVLSEEWSQWPRARIRQLEAERDQLLEKISILPQHDPTFLSDHLGYHSLFKNLCPDDSLPPDQFDIRLPFPPLLDSIALAPAFNPKGSGAYAFPKRFMIEVLDIDTGKFEVVVNWMEEDFPDTGPYPVFFSEINRSVTQVRITIPHVVRESGLAFYALGEIYLFQRQSDGRIGANIIAWGDEFSKIVAPDSLAMPPLWDPKYLSDGVAGFGFQLSDETVVSEDLIISDEARSAISDKVQFTLDLGRLVPIGRIDIWPAAAPSLLALPTFGFPQKVEVELSPEPDFNVTKKLEAKNDRGHMYRGNPLPIIGQGYYAQYVRVTMEGLSTHGGERVLGLGEILVTSNERVWSINCKVAALGIPKEDLNQLPRLVDGCSRQRRILSQGKWIKGLAQRRPLDRRLAVVERELALAQAVWKRIKQRFGIWIGVIVFMGLVGGLVAQRQMRKRGMNKLKWRIARDLHDDVGSNLGSISLTAEQLKHAVVEPEVREELCDLSLMAREACASLREAVWVIDASTIRLPALVQKLVERAERILGGVDLSVEISSDFPDRVVPLTFKRNVIMFFKEAVHNCARHAQATRVWVAFSMDDQYLRISVRDDGCGFDPSVATNGWGLESMQERAGEMGGRVELDSRPEKGTTVALTIPMSALLDMTDHHYKTSN